MTLAEFSEKFAPLPPQQQIRFLYTNIDTLEKEEKIPFLLSLLKEEKASPLVKATALKFLRQASYREFEVYENYVDHNFRAVANAARRAVKEFEEKDKKHRFYEEAVLRKLRSLSDKEKRLKILKAISKLKAFWVLKVLLEALNDPSETNRDFLIKELSQREIWNLTPLYEKLRNPPWYVKSAVLRVLGGRKDSRAIPSIAQTLADSNVDVRRNAADALGEIGGKEALGLLVKLTKDKSIYVRTTAAEALRRASRVKFSG
jgi:3-methyladenine DNA glycosylase AlkC